MVSGIGSGRQVKMDIAGVIAIEISACDEVNDNILFGDYVWHPVLWAD